MFITQEFDVQRITRQGDMEELYPAPPDFSYSGMDTLPPIAEYPAALVVACTAQFDPRLKGCLVYRLGEA